jgi:hypothetical protein
MVLIDEKSRKMDNIQKLDIQSMTLKNHQKSVAKT